MMSEFETTVLRELSEIKESVATTAQAQRDYDRRVTSLERYNEKQEDRQWFKSVVVGAIVVVAHPIARKLGFDI